MRFFSTDMKDRRVTLFFTKIYIWVRFIFPFQIQKLIFLLWFSLITLRLLLILWNLFDPLFATEALVCASFYSEASVTMLGGMNMMGDDDLSRAVAPYLPQGGQAPVNIPEGRPLTVEEEGRLALVLDLQNQIGTLLRNIDLHSFRNHHFEEESASDLAAAALLHKEEYLNDHTKLWEVREGLNRYRLSSRFYFRVVEWVKVERKVRSGELPRTFLIDDDGEGEG